MDIFSHFRQIDLTNGQVAVLEELSRFLSSPEQIFMLKGYAGSGKTTILKGIINYLGKQQRKFEIMAPTGRAAKILRDKTGRGSTIHKAIYNFDQIDLINKDATDQAKHSYHYNFPIKSLSPAGTIIIIDEASMITSVISTHELFTFGTNILLNDLLTYSNLNSGNNKIIFVGDPAQLSPVGDSKSLAFDKDYFEKLNLSVIEVEITEVMRQANNLILQNATAIRNLLQQDHRRELKFEYNQEEFIKATPIDFIENFINSFPKPEIGDGVIISFSNAQCYHYNNAIRKAIFPDRQEITEGDIIMINNNNYHTYDAELFNGDLAKVIAVCPDVIYQSAPVYIDENGESIRKDIKLGFRKIIIRVPHHSDDIPCYIIEDLLDSINRDLTVPEMKSLYINFVMRFNEQQETRKQGGFPTFKVGSEEFKMALKADPFFNALKVKYGYAITCHKSQGGEWDKVFVDYSGRVSLKTDPLRWCYTATTRARKAIVALNAPNFRSITKLKFAPIGRIANLPQDSLSFLNVELSPHHTINMHRCKSWRYWDVMEKIENTEFFVKDVTSFDFHERYTFVNGEQIIIADSYHKGSGHFLPFKIVSSTVEDFGERLSIILNSKINRDWKFDYNPDGKLFEDLFSTVQQFSNELNIPITNVNNGENYFVNYYFLTDAPSYIQFYYNNSQQLTTALPKTYSSTPDQKLISLILKLEEYASS